MAKIRIDFTKPKYGILGLLKEPIFHLTTTLPTLVFSISLILLVYGGIFAADSWTIRERTPSAFNAIVYPSKIAVPVGAFLLFIQALSGFIKDLFFLVKGERL